MDFFGYRLEIVPESNKDPGSSDYVLDTGDRKILIEQSNAKKDRKRQAQLLKRIISLCEKELENGYNDL